MQVRGKKGGKAGKSKGVKKSERRRKPQPKIMYT